MDCEHKGNKSGTFPEKKYLMNWSCDDCGLVLEIIDQREDPLYNALIGRLEKFKLLESIYIDKALKVAQERLKIEKLDDSLEEMITEAAKEDYKNNPSLQHLRDGDNGKYRNA